MKVTNWTKKLSAAILAAAPERPEEGSIEINGQRPETTEAFTAIVAALKKGDVVRLLLRRPDDSIHYVAMRVE